MTTTTVPLEQHLQTAESQRIRTKINTLRESKELSWSVTGNAAFTILCAVVAAIVVLILAPYVWLPVLLGICAAVCGAAILVTGVSGITASCQEHQLRKLKERQSNLDTGTAVMPPQNGIELTEIVITPTETVTTPTET